MKSQITAPIIVLSISRLFFFLDILDSKRWLGTFTVSFGLILLFLFSFLMALFFDWKVNRVLMVACVLSLLPVLFAPPFAVMFAVCGTTRPQQPAERSKLLFFIYHLVI